MRVVLDPCLPHKLRHEFPGHDVFTAHNLGLSRLDDDQLLDALDGHCDVLVTCDQGFSRQQAMASRNIALVIIKSASNDIGDLLPLVPKVLSVLSAIRPGEVREVS